MERVGSLDKMKRNKNLSLNPFEKPQDSIMSGHMNTLEGARTSHNNSVMVLAPPLILSKHQHFSSIDSLSKQ